MKATINEKEMKNLKEMLAEKDIDRSPITQKPERIKRVEFEDKRIKCPGYVRLGVSCDYPVICRQCSVNGASKGLSTSFTQRINHRDYLDELDRFTSAGKHFFVLADAEDYSAHEIPTELLKTLITRFALKSNARLLIATRATDIEELGGLNHGYNTIFLFSLQPNIYQRILESKAPSLEDQLVKMQILAQAGYPLRVRIDPAILIPGWLKYYVALIKKTFKNFSPERITLGILRHKPDSKVLMKKRLEEIDPTNPLLGQLDSLEPQLSEAMVDGQMSQGLITYPEGIRINIYRLLIEEIRSCSGIPIALCQETSTVWKSVGLSTSKMQCNCVEDRVDLTI